MTAHRVNANEISARLQCSSLPRGFRNTPRVKTMIGPMLNKRPTAAAKTIHQP